MRVLWKDDTLPRRKEKPRPNLIARVAENGTPNPHNPHSILSPNERRSEIIHLFSQIFNRLLEVENQNGSDRVNT